MSVIVPAYRPGPGIGRVISSLDAQTMPAEEFELIVVDDGSPDDTWERLQAIRDSHDNVRIERIENSGWPSRPRNIGIDMARGEYVLFMDHDDEIYPDGLRAAYEYASEHGADVLSPKESKTNDIGWGISNYTGDIPNAKPTRGIASLLPMMPHKFYRTAFLREHDIRFPEGRRMLWEDIYFNVAAFRYAEVISILSTTPVYRWVETDTNNSATYGVADEEYWEKLTALVRYVEQKLPGEEHAEPRDAVLRHLYRGRVVDRLYTALTREPDGAWLAVAREHANALMAAHMPPEYDEHLSPVSRVRAALMRADRYDLLARLAREGRDWRAQTRVRSLAWQPDGGLEITVVTRWAAPDGTSMTFRRSGDRVLLELPADVLAVVGESADVTEALQKARSQLVVRDRGTATTWAVKTRSNVELEDESGDLVTPVVTGTGVLVADRDRTHARWEVHAKSSVVGMQQIRAVLAQDQDTVAPAVVSGCAVEPIVLEGTLVVDLHHDWKRYGSWSLDAVTLQAVAGDSDIQVTADVVTPVLHGKTVTIPGAAYATPASAIASKLLLSRRTAGLVGGLRERLVTDGGCRLYLSPTGTSRLRIILPLLPDGRYRLVAHPSTSIFPVAVDLRVAGSDLTAAVDGAGS